MTVNKILGSLKNLISIFTNFFKEINRRIVIYKAQKEISRKLSKFKVEFDEFLNEYYDYLPIPQGKSIIQNTTRAGKTFYLVIFNDIRKKHAAVLEIFSDPYFPLPSHYNLLQKFDITTFMEKIKENIQNSIESSIEKKKK